MSSVSSPTQPAAPPSRLEIERKLSFKSAAPPRPGESSKRGRKPSIGALPLPPPISGNESDSSSVTSSVHPGQMTSPNLSSSQHPGSPILSPVVGLSSIAERERKGFRGSSMGVGEDLDPEVELEDVEEDDEEGEGATDEEFGEGGVGTGSNGGGELERGMEGERVVKSGYLWKKQERRKAWKKRWFVLRTVKLAYYKDDKEYSLCRLLDLHTVHTVAPVAVKKNPFSFGIVTSKRTFFVKASSQDEMEEWVRAINGVRRRLGERQEERGIGEKAEGGPRQSSAPSKGINIPQRDRADTIDSHQGTYTSVFSTTTQGSVSTSPSTAGYFGNRNPTGYPAHQLQAVGSISPVLGSGGALPPPSPMATTNTLTAQLAKVSLSPQPLSLNNPPRHPSNPPVAPSTPGVRALSSRREPSASSVSSEYFPRSPNVATSASLMTPSLGQSAAGASSDEDEAYFSDPNTAFPMVSESQSGISGQQGSYSPVDPNKVILSAYLMKRSKGRGRKVWRKRWFYLTSQGLTYTKSHMDSRALRYIPLTSVLDALDVASSDEGSSSDSSPPLTAEKQATSHFPHSPSFRAKPQGQFHVDSPNPNTSTSKAGHHVHPHQSNENTFRLITSKRTYVLCAPSEEDEIKWLAAFRALLNRERAGSAGGLPISPIHGNGQSQIPVVQRSSVGGTVSMAVPMITQQPPTPASTLPPIPSLALGTVGESPPTASTVPGPPVLGVPASTSPDGRDGTMVDGHEKSIGQGNQQMAGMARGRSATQSAKSAVADVVRRFHPDGASVGG